MNEQRKKYMKKFYDQHRYKDLPPEVKLERMQGWREWNTQTKYGVAYTEIITMWEKQGKKCAICGKSLVPGKHSDGFRVDHDHKTGKIRGILCFRCNVGLGLFDDSIMIMKKVIDYLERRTP